MDGRLVYGLDLGINNVGWCALRKQKDGVDILAVGTFVFDSPLADESKPGEGLKSKLRGQFRRARRTTRRRHQRKMDLYRLLAKHGFLPRKMADRVELFCKQTDPYALRAAALERKLEPYELGRVLCHLNQRRGFLSPRDLMLWGTTRFEDDEEPEEGAAGKDKDEERGQIKKELRRTREEMAGFETVGAYLNSRLRQGATVRKRKIKGATQAQQRAEDERRFRRTDRHMIEHEFWTIMDRQASHNPLLTKDLQGQIHDLLFFQRILAADASTRGKCTFYKNELRMPRAGLTAQKFVLAQDVANLSVMPSPEAEFRVLTPEERERLVAELMKGTDLAWDEVRKELELPAAIFNIEPAKYKIIGKDGKEKTVTQKSGTKEKLRGSQTVARMRRILGDKWDLLGEQAQRELVGEIVSIRDWKQHPNKRPEAYRRLDLFQKDRPSKNGVKFSEREANELATVDLPEGYLSVSLKAAKKILPHMLKDKVYSEACQAAGFDHANPEGELPTVDRLTFPTDKDIAHAVVRASVRGAVRILNALHSDYGKPDAIHIELPRDLAMGAEQREEVEKRQRKNETERKEIAKDLVALGYKPNGTNIKKVRLWKELGGAALPYEPDVLIPDLKALMSGDYEVDHIVPRSHALDSGMANLTLCTREFNTQVKGNQTLWEAVGQREPERWRRIEAHVKSIKNMPLHKRQRILAKERPEDFSGRHLAATGYISREVLKLAQRMVENKTDVVVAPGRATSEFRKFWEIEDMVPLHPEEQAIEDAWKAFLAKADAGQATEEDVKNAKPPGKTRSNFKHHALDAIVVALADRKSLKAMTDFFQLVELRDPRLRDKEHRKLERAKTMPDPNLRNKVAAALERAEIVHRPQRMPKGQLHKQQPDENVVRGMRNGEPWGTEVVGKHLVKYDQEGRPAQAYPLGSNHHVVIWETTQPNQKGEYERAAEVVTMLEAVRRRDGAAAARKWNKDHPEGPLRPIEPVIRKTRPEPGWRFVMALCKGDMVEMSDGSLGLIESISIDKGGQYDCGIWHPFVANKMKDRTPKNGYLITRVRSERDFGKIAARVVLDPLGQVVYREGGRE
ncbi:MAG: type II CRISPR RNA-guided endonuclease Cas9 [Fimbriimonadaceae bacterium]|nr:CRISPR-associated endonuclease Cas9 [Fimbriimonadaceae bacterium]MCL4283602.1 type II CRISPR RNA-guided endonuclease Cas9 [Fimbriimonadaceae bacterium]MCZ7579644.1 type II CRISPR RNA-guided endonuclease Cas9 [Fimbriimonadaceae bacterium]QOJ11347.1 MAG: type II CRISPR RNA-guided endonuclease Cas9 [Chthonomonadaceae bacterium]